jgi:hypothetical protein
MAESSIGVVVAEKMLTEVARAGDLESLMIWARQGVRATSARPLFAAAEYGHSEVVRLLVQQMKIDINQVSSGGATALLFAAHDGNLAVVRCLLELGAEVGAVNKFGDTTLLTSALAGRYSTTQFLLEHRDANIDDVNNGGETVWGLLTDHLKYLEEWEDLEDLGARSGLLRVLALRGALPPALVALLSPEDINMVQEGARLRARLPAYLGRRRALLDAHCPVLLPPLRALVHGYMELTTAEELWATGLGTAP